MRCSSFMMRLTLECLQTDELWTSRIRNIIRFISLSTHSLFFWYSVFFLTLQSFNAISLQTNLFSLITFLIIVHFSSVRLIKNIRSCMKTFVTSAINIFSLSEVNIVWYWYFSLLFSLLFEMMFNNRVKASTLTFLRSV